MDELRAELDALIDATCVVASGDEVPQATRAWNRFMQMAIAKARSSARDQATVFDVLWALCGECDVPAADFLARHKVTRADLAARTS